jgi:hypothetical protein
MRGWHGQAAGGRLRKLGSWQELLPPPPAAGEEGSAGAGGLLGLSQRRAQELCARRSTSLGDAGSSLGVEQPPPLPAQEEPGLRKQASGSRKRKLHCEREAAPAGAEGGGAEVAAQAAAGCAGAPAPA